MLIELYDAVNESYSKTRTVKRHNDEEAKLVNKGWKYVDVGKNMKVLVPCDDTGMPTKIGHEKIEKWKRIVL